MVCFVTQSINQLLTNPILDEQQLALLDAYTDMLLNQIQQDVNLLIETHQQSIIKITKTLNVPIL